MPAARSSRDHRVSMMGDSSRRMIDSRQPNGTTNQEYYNNTGRDGNFNTVRHGKSPSNMGFGMRLQKAPAAGTAVDYNDDDAGDGKRRERLPRSMFKPGLIIRGPLHVSLAYPFVPLKGKESLRIALRLLI